MKLIVIICLLGLIVVMGLYSLVLESRAHPPAPVVIERALSTGLFDRMRYEEDIGALQLVFTNGYRYEYLGVPRSCVQGFLLSPYKGDFFNRRIRRCFPFRRLSPLEDPGEPAGRRLASR